MDRTRQLRCDCLASRLSLALLELNPRFFNNLRATSCRKMASMNAWRDSNEVAGNTISGGGVTHDLDTDKVHNHEQHKLLLFPF
ncbi:hypothetical protein E2C01_055954 [Portunus trituberculatus]|uniref:Uncharacterized protein n=1 Tax=Portunus trituberculatus TaxID=210409 RepID=A0A5B7GXP6_PORTR|nr:hypothetical protein [Portunus trituberculatus]